MSVLHVLHILHAPRDLDDAFLLFTVGVTWVYGIVKSGTLCVLLLLFSIPKGFDFPCYFLPSVIKLNDYDAHGY